MIGSMLTTCSSARVARQQNPSGLLESGIPMVAAVSAPSSLAIDLAGECGITLIGFLRGANFNIYTHPERVTT